MKKIIITVWLSIIILTLGSFVDVMGITYNSLYLTVLYTLYNHRPDLQAAFPEAANGGNLTNLIGWAASAGITVDTQSSILLPFAPFLVLQNLYNHRPDLQAAFPEAGINGTLTNLIGWAASAGITVDTQSSILLPFAPFLVLQNLYDNRSDLQTEFPEAANGGNQTNLICWAATTGITSDAAKTILLPYASSYTSQCNTSKTHYGNAIYIIGENSLQIGTNGISQGDGSQQNPYLIQNWILSPNNSNGITVINTTQFIEISNVEITGGANGIIIQNSGHVTIDNVTITNPSQSGIAILGSHDIMIDNSTLTDISGPGVYTNDGYNIQNDTRISLVGNTIENTEAQGMYLTGNNTLIANNKIIDPGVSGILLVSPFSNSFITGNYIEGAEQDAIYIFGYKYTLFVPPIGQFPQDSTNLYVVNNELYDIHNDGIELAMGTTNSVVLGNYIHDSPLADGVHPGQMNSLDMWKYDDNDLYLNNRVANMGGTMIYNAAGILMTDNTNNTAEYNTITNAGLYGSFLLWDDSTAPMPAGNTMSHNCFFSEAAPYGGYANLINSQNLTQTNSVNLSTC